MNTPHLASAILWGSYRCTTAQYSVIYAVRPEQDGKFSLHIRSNPADTKLHKLVKTMHASLVDALLKLAEHVKEGNSETIHIDL